MKIIAATAFALSTFAAPVVLVATPASALTCGVDAPAGWERPGGFCDALKSTKSLSVLGTGGNPAAPVGEPEKEGCPVYEEPEGYLPELQLHLQNLDIGERIHVAIVVCIK